MQTIQLLNKFNAKPCIISCSAYIKRRRQGIDKNYTDVCCPHLGCGKAQVVFVSNFTLGQVRRAFNAPARRSPIPADTTPYKNKKNMTPEMKMALWLVALTFAVLVALLVFQPF